MRTDRLGSDCPGLKRSRAIGAKAISSDGVTCEAQRYFVRGRAALILNVESQLRFAATQL